MPLFCKEHLRIVEMSLLFQYNRVKFAYKRKEMNRDDRNKNLTKNSTVLLLWILWIFA